MSTGALTRGDVMAAQRTIAYCAFDTAHLDELDDTQREALRRQTFRFLAAMPEPAGDLRIWMRQAAAALQDAACALASPPKHTGGRTLPAGVGLAGHDANTVFAPAHDPPRAQTVHSIKGEDRDAVMVVIRRAHASDPTSQLELWEAAVGKGAVDEEKHEERRVLFVALTRARQYCLVALPDDRRGEAVAASCVNLGFRLSS
jgi:hypothetical protein